MLELRGVQRNHDGSLVTAERRRSGDPGQGGEQRTHAIEGKILQVPLRAIRAAEYQLPHRDAAGVEAGDKWRHRSRRHESARAVHVAHGLRHRLRHIRAFVEDQFHQRRALNALAFHAIDAGDVEEMIFVVVREITFHLSRVHAAIGLGHINGRLANFGKDVDRHTLYR